MTLRSCSPSGAERWGNCPRSLALAEDAPRPGPSWHSARGHVLHHAASRVLPDLMSADNDRFPRGYLMSRLHEGRREYAEECTAVGYNPTREDAEAVEWATLSAFEIVCTPGWPIRVDLETVFPPPIWLPMRRGPTIDVYYVSEDGHHGIIDYKFGRREVKSDCIQMLIYADAVFSACANAYDQIDLTIVQPPFDYVTLSFAREEIRERVKGYVTAAIEAQMVTATDNPADYNPGPWCHFCPARGICPRTKEKMRERAMSSFADLIEEE